MSTKPTIGWIGAGRMGAAMASFILKAGYPLSVYSRTAASRAKLVALGAVDTESVAQCTRGAEVIFACVSDDAALREVALGEAGVLHNAATHAVFADTSTVSSEVSAEIARAAEQRALAYLRMPISGNAASAVKGEVTVMVSGPQVDWLRVQPVTQTFSKAQLYLGQGEEARVMKLVVNSMVITMAQGMAEALTLGKKAGLDWNVMLDTLAQSTIASPWLKAKCALMKPRDFNPTMTSRLIMKDVDLILGAARGAEVPMPLTATTRQLLQALIGEGCGEEDYMALIKLMEKQSGIVQ